MSEPDTIEDTSEGASCAAPCSLLDERLTPETDREEYRVTQGALTMNVVDAKFARKLERERDELRSALAEAWNDRNTNLQTLPRYHVCELDDGTQKYEESPKGDWVSWHSLQKILKEND